MRRQVPELQVARSAGWFGWPSARRERVHVRGRAGAGVSDPEPACGMREHHVASSIRDRGAAGACAGAGLAGAADAEGGVSELEKRKWCYVQAPNVYEIAPCS